MRDVANTFFGDANLDGEFNSSDLILVFQSNQYEDGIPRNSSWETGDWNGDGEFDTADLIKAFQENGYETGRRATAATVPEPEGSLILFVSMLTACQMVFGKRLKHELKTIRHAKLPTQHLK